MEFEPKGILKIEGSFLFHTISVAIDGEHQK